MANRKVLIDGILGLAQKLGANPNKFMGTKSNINFLGTGDRGMKGTTFSGQLNEDFLDLGFGKNDMIKIIEQDAGYVTAGKLNDVQLNTMFNNLKMIDETFNPPAGPMNVIDLETGTKGLNKEGLESLRETDKIKRFTQGLGTSKTAMSNKIKEGIESIKTKLKAPFNMKSAVDDIERVEKQAAENNFIKAGAADFTDFVSAEGGRRAVVRQVMKNNANYFGLTPEVAESIAKSKDLGKGGSNFPDPLLLFRNKGNFTTDELTKIDEIIEANPFDDVKVIADKVSDYVQSIRPDGFAEGGRIGYRSGKSVKGIAELLKLGKGQLKTADKIDRPASAKLSDEFERFNKRSETYGGPYSDDYYRKSLETEELVNVDELPIELLDAEAIMVKYPGITERLARLIGNDTNLQRKAEALSAIDQAMALRGAGKSADETIAILKSEPETKMKKGGLAQILEM